MVLRWRRGMKVFARSHPSGSRRRQARAVRRMVAVDWPGGRETKEYLGHKKKVHSLAWNSSGEKLASGSVDQSVRSASRSFSLTLTHLAIVARWRRSILPKCPRCHGALRRSRQPPPLAGARLGHRPDGPLHGHGAQGPPGLRGSAAVGPEAARSAWDRLGRQDCAHMGHALRQVRQCDRDQG